MRNVYLLVSRRKNLSAVLSTTTTIPSSVSCPPRIVVLSPHIFAWLMELSTTMTTTVSLVCSFKKSFQIDFKVRTVVALLVETWSS